MKLEIRNLQSQATYEIDPEGAVLGREGSKADIVLRDQAVSKKHAKIYEKNGRWYLEDLASSNGTFVDNRRITEPVILSPGAVFALSENQFEVVQIINGANGKAAFDREADSRDAPYQENLDDLPPLGMMPGEDSQDGKRSSRSMPKNQAARAASPSAGADPADDIPPPGADQKGVGYFFIAVPKAIAYYLAAIPLMLVNPIGSIRKSVNEQRFPAMGWMQLAAYAIPPMVFAQALGQIVAFIVSLVHGSFAIGALIPGLPIAVAIGIVSAVISGLVFHPVMKWVINFLKGESDEKSRTNYFITIMTANAIFAVPGAITSLFASFGILPLTIIPLLIQTAATIIMLFIVWTWMKFFNVVTWLTKYVIPILGLLTVLGTGVTLVTTIIASVQWALAGGGSTAVAGAGTVDTSGMTAEQKEAFEKSQAAANAALAAAGAANADAIKKAQEDAAKAMAAAGADPEALKKANEAAIKAAEEAAKAAANAGSLSAEQQAAVKKAQEDAAAATKEAMEKAEKAGAAATAAAQKAADEAAKKEEAAAKKEAELAAKKEKENAKKQKSEEPEEVEDSGSDSGMGAKMAAPKLPAGASPFEDFLAKRTAVETAFEKDPSLIKKADLRDMYEKYWKKTFEIRAKWAKKKEKDQAKQKVNDRYKDLEVYEGTGKMVQQLYQKIYQ